MYAVLFIVVLMLHEVYAALIIVVLSYEIPLFYFHGLMMCLIVYGFLSVYTFGEPRAVYMYDW